MHGDIEGVADGRNCRHGQNHHEQDEPGSSSASGVRRLCNPEGLDERRRECFQKPHTSILRKHEPKRS